MPDKPNATSEANAAFKQDWIDLIAFHNTEGRPQHSNVFPDLDLQILQSVYNQFLLVSEFPDNHTAITSLNGFSEVDRHIILYYLDSAGVHSQMKLDTQQNILQLIIRDGNNPKHKVSPVTIMQEQKGALSVEHVDIPVAAEDIDFILPDDEPVAQAAPAPAPATPAKPLYIPPFNFLLTPANDAYILLEHMHLADMELLSEALKSRGVNFRERDSGSCGLVFKVPFNIAQLSIVGEMAKESRTQENLQRIPDIRRIYLPTVGDPAINVLSGKGEMCIPLEGMTQRQKTALSERLQNAGIPFVQKNESSFGDVYAVRDDRTFSTAPDDKTTLVAKLYKLSEQLRNEHNDRKKGTVIEPAPNPFSAPAPA